MNKYIVWYRIYDSNETLWVSSEVKADNYYVRPDGFLEFSKKGPSTSEVCPSFGPYIQEGKLTTIATFRNWERVELANE